MSTDRLTLHPRVRATQDAANALGDALEEISTRYALTANEQIRIVALLLSDLTRYMVESERRDADPES